MTTADNGPYTFVLSEKRSYPGIRRHPTFGVWVLDTKNGQLPRGLEGAEAQPHTWEWLIQRDLNGEPSHAIGGRTPRLQAHQAPRVDEIVAAYADSRPGYVLAYPTGAGKTYIAIAAINRIAPKRVLVITRLSHTRTWRSTLARHGTGTTEWVVINPDRLSRLFSIPNATVPLHELGSDRDAAAVQAGSPLTHFDVVITDEAQILAHADTLRSQLWRRLIGWSDDTNGPTSFTLNMSATNWTEPGETSSAAHLLAYMAGVPCPSASEVDIDYSAWLRDRLRLTGYSQTSGRWFWQENTRDVAILTDSLYNGTVGAAATRAELGLPDQVRRLCLVDFTPDERRRYEQAWAEFRQAEGLPAHHVPEPSSGREAHLRFMQKAALIKAPYVASLVVDALVDGYQVVVPAWLEDTVETLFSAISEEARKRIGEPRLGTWAVRLTGRTEPDKRHKTIELFQSGVAPVIITSVLDAISLHAGQVGGGIKGQDANDKPRITIFGDVIYGGKQPFQAEGRAGRDGQEADAIYVCAAGTTEVLTMARTFRKLTNTRALTSTGDTLYSDADIRSFAAMADELDDSLDISQEGGTGS